MWQSLNNKKVVGFGKRNISHPFLYFLFMIFLRKVTRISLIAPFVNKD
jgi:hypothetical protein